MGEDPYEKLTCIHSAEGYALLCFHYCKFLERKHNIDAFSGSSDARFLLIIWPAFEKSLSKGVLVAGMHNTLLAVAAIAGKQMWLFFNLFDCDP